MIDGASLRFPTPLRGSALRARLRARRFARDLRVLGVVGSTSDLALDLARRGAGDGLVIVAEGQTSGRGRRGASWSSPSRRGLYLSIVLQPAPEEAERRLLAPALGLAMAETVDRLGVRAGVKWPNDVLVAGLKVGGCLVDLGTSPEGSSFAVCGLGLNANFTRDDLVSDGPVPAGSLALLAGRRIDREALAAGLLDTIANVLAELTSGATEPLVERFLARDALKDAAVIAQQGDQVLDGRVLEAHPALGLLLATTAGTNVRLRPEHTHLLRVTLPA